MTRPRILVALAIAVTLLGASAFTEASPFRSCLFAAEGCGTGTDECKYDCAASMTCARSGNPFEMCECTSGFCKTTECPIVE